MTSPCARKRTVRTWADRLWREPARDERGSAAVELGIGTVVVIAIAAIAVDLYALSKADASAAHIAVTMAEHVTREQAPDGGEMAALGRYLYEHELGAPGHLVFVVSAVQQAGNDDPAKVLWDDDTLRYGDTETTARLVTECRARGTRGWRRTLFGLGDDDPRVALPNNTVAIVVEVCAKLTLQGSLTGQFIGENIYRLHAAPVRDKGQSPPASPVHSSAGNAVGPWPSAGGGSLVGLTRAASGPAPVAATAGAA